MPGHRSFKSRRVFRLALLVASSVIGAAAVPRAVAAADQTCVEGVVRHKDDEGVARPSRDVTVRILDHDETGQDDQLAVVRSDGNGAFSACFVGEESDDGVGGPSGQDLFVRVEADTFFWTVETGASTAVPELLHYETCPCDHADVAPGSTVDFGVVSPSSVGASKLDPGFFAFDRTKLVFDWFAPTGPAWKKRLTIEWDPDFTLPGVAGYAPWASRIKLDKEDPYFSDGQIVMHEVAHHVMADHYGFSPGTGTAHELWEDLLPEDAFSEGFADWVAVEAIGEETYGGFDIEIPTWDIPDSFDPYYCGDRIEIRVLALLHDLSDLENEWPWDRVGDGSSGPGKVWETIAAGKPWDMAEFIDEYLFMHAQGEASALGPGTPLGADIRATLFQNTFYVDPDERRFRELLDPVQYEGMTSQSLTHVRPPAYVEHGYQLPTSELAWSLLALSESDQKNHSRSINLYQDALFSSPGSEVANTFEPAERPVFVAVRGHEPGVQGAAKVWYAGIEQDDKLDTMRYQVARDPGKWLNKNLMHLDVVTPLGLYVSGLGAGVTQAGWMHQVVSEGIEVITLNGFEVGVEQTVRLAPLGPADFTLCLLSPDSEYHTDVTAICKDQNGAGGSEVLTFTPDVPDGWGLVAIGPPPALVSPPLGTASAAILYVDDTGPTDVNAGVLCVFKCTMFFRAEDPQTAIGWVRWSFTGSLKGRPWVRWRGVSTSMPLADPVYAPASQITDCPTETATPFDWKVEHCYEHYGSLDEIGIEDGVMHTAAFQVMNNSGMISPVHTFEYLAPIGGGSDVPGLSPLGGGMDDPTPPWEGAERGSAPVEGSIVPGLILGEGSIR